MTTLQLIRPTGDIDRHTGRDAFLVSYIFRPSDPVTVDFTDVALVDVAGLGFLAAFNNRLAEVGGGVRVIGATPSHVRVFVDAGLTALLADQ